MLDQLDTDTHSDTILEFILYILVPVKAETLDLNTVTDSITNKRLGDTIKTSYAEIETDLQLDGDLNVTVLILKTINPLSSVDDVIQRSTFDIVDNGRLNGKKRAEGKFVGDTHVILSHVSDILNGIIDIVSGGGDTRHNAKLGVCAHCDEQGSDDN